MNNEPFSNRALELNLDQVISALAYFTKANPPDKEFIQGLHLKRTMLESAKTRIECQAILPFVGGADFVDFIGEVSTVAWADMPRHD